MFRDPVGQFDFALPPGWAYDVDQSHLIAVRHRRWDRPDETLHVRVMPTNAVPDATSDAWHAAIAERVFGPKIEDVTRLRAGKMPAALAEARQTDCYLDPSLETFGWHCFNSDKRAHPAGLKAANGWGRFDTAGNVYEWCNDLYKPRGYGTGELLDPSGMLGDSTNLTLNPPEQRRVARGGDYLMPAYTSKNNWHVDFSDQTFGANLGVRLARTLHEQP